MMYVDPTSQYKFVAKSTPSVPTSDTTSAHIAGDNAAGSAAENIIPGIAQTPPNNATHFQAPEHAQKQAALAQTAGTLAVPISPSQVLPSPGQIIPPGQAAGIPGQGLTYDGKRMRKTMQRRTVDYNSSVIRFLETRKWFKSSRNQHALQPQEIYNIDVVPPCGYIKNPMNSVTTKFVRTSTNKLRCPIFCVVWTPEGRRLVTGASSGEFTLWNGLTFNFETILQAHDRAVRSMVWSHNDLWLLTGDHGGFVKYWQSNMNNVKMYEAHKEPVRGLSFSPSDNKFASCSDDGLVKVWDFYRCAEERELKGHGADVKCVDWHPTKGLIVSGSKDSQQPVKLWDPKSGNSITTLHCHKSTVMAAKWNSNGNWLVTGSRDHLLKLFDIRMMKELQAFRGHKKEATVVAWHPVHETLFASGGSDGSLMFWLTGVDEKAGGMEKAHEGIVWSLSWHPLGHILCSGSNDHTSKFWARNRPGDAMTDKYNLDIQGIPEDGEYSEEGTSQMSVPALAAYDASQVIPGVGLPVTASKVVLPDGRDVDAHLYGESGKDKRKAAVIKSSTASSQFPYPPAFRQPAFDNRYGNVPQGIPGLDLSNTDAQQENEGYKIPHFPAQPKLRLPTHLPTHQVNPGNQLMQGSIPLLSNRPPFGPGPRHSFDYRGPPGPRGLDANFGPPGQFQGNQFMRFPPPQVPGVPRGGFGPRTGPVGPHVESWGAPHHLGPRGGSFDPHRTQDIHRAQNTPDYYGQRGGLQEGPRPHGSPISPHVRPDGQHGGPRPPNIPTSQHGGPRPPIIPTSQHGLMDNLLAAPRSRGPSTDSNPHPDGSKPPLSLPSGLPGGPHSRRSSSDPNARLDNPSPYDHGAPKDAPQGGSLDAPISLLEASPYSGPKQADAPPVQHAANTDGTHANLRPLLSVPSSPIGSRESSQGPRPSTTGSSARLDRPHGIPSSQHGPRPLLSIAPSSENFAPRAMNNNGHPFGPRGPRPPGHFQQSRPDQPKSDLKSPEGEKRGPPEPRENVLRRSRDSSPRNSPPVSASNHVKQERRTSDPDAPGILGDFKTHLIKEVERNMLDIGRYLGHATGDIARHDRPPHSRSDTDRPLGPDTSRPGGRTRDRDLKSEDRRGDRPSYDRPARDRAGDHDRDRPSSERSDMARRDSREDRSHDRSDMGRPRDRSVFEGRPRDRPLRGSPQDRVDGHRPSFDRQDSGRNSDRSFSDENDVPAHEKPGLLPIPDMFLGRVPLSADTPPRDPVPAHHRPLDRRHDHGRFQDARNDIRPDNLGFSRGPRDHNPPEGSTKSGGSNSDVSPPASETNIKPLMSLLDAPPVTLGSPPGLGGVEGRGRKRSMEHEFDRAPKRMGMGDNRERPR